MFLISDVTPTPNSEDYPNYKLDLIKFYRDVVIGVSIAEIIIFNHNLNEIKKKSENDEKSSNDFDKKSVIKILIVFGIIMFMLFCLLIRQFNMVY